MAALGAVSWFDDGLLGASAMLCIVMASLAAWRYWQYRTLNSRNRGRQSRALRREQQEMADSIEELVVRLEELSTRIGEQVDAKQADLRAAMQQADEQIARLELLAARQPRLARAAGDSTPSPVRSGDSDTPRLERSSADDRAARDPLVERVRRLARSGSSAAAIAAKLGAPLGEVELILNVSAYQC